MNKNIKIQNDWKIQIYQRINSGSYHSIKKTTTVKLDLATTKAAIGEKHQAWFSEASLQLCK